jgi:hypothetical protein
MIVEVTMIMIHLLLAISDLFFVTTIRHVVNSIMNTAKMTSDDHSNPYARYNGDNPYTMDKIIDPLVLMIPFNFNILIDKIEQMVMIAI